jgi:DNA-binding NarL/FixJ family response regulator
MPITPQLAVEVLETFGDALPESLDQEILLLVASGYTPDEIAARLHLSVGAIEAHLATVLDDLVCRR